jgi:hypothetical protein
MSVLDLESNGVMNLTLVDVVRSGMNAETQIGSFLVGAAWEVGSRVSLVGSNSRFTLVVTGFTICFFA